MLYIWIIVAWIIVCAVVVLLLIMRSRNRSSDAMIPNPDELQAALRRFHTGGTVEPADYPPGFFITLPGERIAMQNRFRRDQALADQIVADQSVMRERPGKRVHAPSPGEFGYVPPTSRLCVTVGDMTVILRRDGGPLLRERTPNGAEGPEIEVPAPWDDVVTNFAFALAMERDRG